MPSHGLMTIAAATLLLGACATGRPVVSTASSSGVTLRAKTGQLDRAERLAREHCAKFGRLARQDRVVRGKGENQLVSFICV